ncbi:hypothetical protein NN561_019137 [Cricetulus griseus]
MEPRFGLLTSAGLKGAKEGGNRLPGPAYAQVAGGDLSAQGSRSAGTCSAVPLTLAIHSLDSGRLGSLDAWARVVRAVHFCSLLTRLKQLVEKFVRFSSCALAAGGQQGAEASACGPPRQCRPPWPHSRQCLS